MEDNQKKNIDTYIYMYNIFEACCFFILGFVLTINPVVIIMLTICNAFLVISTLHVSSHFIPESYEAGGFIF